MFILSITRRITSIGHGAPAMMPVRSDCQVEARKLRMLQFGDEHRRHAIERRALLLLHRRQRHQRIEALAGKDHRCAMRHGREVAHHHAEAVIERHRDAHPVVLGQRHGAADEIAVVENVVVRQRHALRRAGGAAGELDVDRIVELQALRQRGQHLAMAVAPHARHLLEGDRAGLLRSADLDDGAQLRQLWRLQFARQRNAPVPGASVLTISM